MPALGLIFMPVRPRKGWRQCHQEVAVSAEINGPLAIHHFPGLDLNSVAMGTSLQLQL